MSETEKSALMEMYLKEHGYWVDFLDWAETHENKTVHEIGSDEEL